MTVTGPEGYPLAGDLGYSKENQAEGIRLAKLAVEIGTGYGKPVLDIIDIRQDDIKLDLQAEITSLLHQDRGKKRMPTLLLYDEKGLQLFEKITFLDEYYLTNAEIDILTRLSKDIAQSIQSDSIIVELGSGNLRKVSLLLQALDDAGKNIDYYALDLSITELERTLAAVPSFRHVKCHGLHGTYDDGLTWLKTGSDVSRPKCVLSLGSSIGNFSRNEAADFLRGFAQALQPGDSMLLGVDACNDGAKVYHAYNDREGVTHKFVLNGLDHANNILGNQIFNVDDWEVIGEYVHDIGGGRHQAFFSPLKDTTIQGIHIPAGERIQVEQSLKYSPAESKILWNRAGLKEVVKWSASQDPYNFYAL